MRLLRQGLNGSGGGSLLDIGCGDGAFLARARAAGLRVAGVELNGELARARGLTVHERVADAIAQAPYSVITLWHSLEHFTDPAETLRAAHRLLAPDGTLIVAVPDFASLQARLTGRSWLHLDVPRHLYHFTPEALRGLLAATGFVPVRQYAGELEYDLIGFAQSALNMVMPTPNVLFRVLSKRATGTGKVETAAALALAVPLSLLSAVATLVTTAAGRGGTLVVAARRNVIQGPAATSA
jgi:SAM-dependent methyltransferase